MDELEKRLQNLKKPNVMTEHQEYIKVPLLNARRSAALGWWFVALPCFFLACVVMKYHFSIGVSFANTFFDTFANFDRSHGWWFSPLIFFLFPLVAAAMNLLSILNISYDKQQKKLNFSLKVEFWNIVLVIIGFAIAFVISFKVIHENLNREHLDKLHKTESRQ